MSKSTYQNIYSLIGKKLSDQISEEENQLLQEWKDSSEEAKRQYEKIREYWSNIHFSYGKTRLVTEEEVSEQVWNKVFNKNAEKKYNRFDIVKLIKIAAVFILFVVAPYTVYHFLDHAEQQAPQVTTIIKETLPGQKSSIALQDGTIVWLNSGSSISYWTDYNEKIRLIELEGQAFFEVFKDPTKPFFVKCRDLKVEALGTSFDVNGYSDSPIQVSLLTGKVKLSLPMKKDNDDQVILLPGEYSVLSQDNRFIEKGTFDSYEVLAWKEGRIIFNNTTINEIVPELELWFGVKFQGHETIDPDRPFTTTFSKESLDNILMNIGGVLNFEYSIEGNNVYLKSKKLPM